MSSSSPKAGSLSNKGKGKAEEPASPTPDLVAAPEEETPQDDQGFENTEEPGLQ